MEVCNLETTVIDNLVVCFLASPDLLDNLRYIHTSSSYTNFRILRAEGRFHRHFFNLYTEDYQKLGNLYFDRYASQGNELYVWLKIENSCLYDRSYMDIIDMIMRQFEFVFHGITSLDLARDFDYNVASRIRALMRREDLAVIINGREVKERDKTLTTVFRTCGMSLARDGVKGLTIKQAKSAKNKHMGITLDCYDKAEEIRNASGKKYIRDFYGGRKRLYRLELRMNCEQIKRAVENTGYPYSRDLLEWQTALDGIFIYALQSMLRFRKGRTVQQWEDIFKMRCQGI
jgi:hypothetical protein